MKVSWPCSHCLCCVCVCPGNMEVSWPCSHCLCCVCVCLSNMKVSWPCSYCFCSLCVNRQYASLMAMFSLFLFSVRVQATPRKRNSIDGTTEATAPSANLTRQPAPGRFDRLSVVTDMLDCKSFHVSVCACVCVCVCVCMCARACIILISVMHMQIYCGVCVFMCVCVRVFPYNTLCKLFLIGLCSTCV